MHAQLELMLLTGHRPRRKAPVYFDTTLLPRDSLSAAIARAEGQDDKVLAVFRAHAALTPSECQRHLEAAGERMLLTSVRRSISTLTDARVLDKTAQKRPGPYGMPEFVWTLLTPQARAA